MKTAFLKLGFNSLTRYISRNSTTILTGLAVTGVATTVISGVTATVKAVRKLQQDDIIDANLYLYDDRKAKDIVKSVWPLYVPTAVIGSLTMACIFGSHTISNRKAAALAGLYTTAEKTLKEYQSKVIDKVGEKKEKAIQEELAKDAVSNSKGAEIYMTGNGDSLCYDILSGRYFTSNIEFLRKAQNDFNRDLINDMWGTLNDFYDRINISGIKIGDDIGWNVDRMLSLKFTGALTEENKPCIVVDHEVRPFPTFR